MRQSSSRKSRKTTVAEYILICCHTYFHCTYILRVSSTVTNVLNINSEYGNVPAFADPHEWTILIVQTTTKLRPTWPSNIASCTSCTGPACPSTWYRTLHKNTFTGIVQNIRMALATSQHNQTDIMKLPLYVYRSPSPALALNNWRKTTATAASLSTDLVCNSLLTWVQCSSGRVSDSLSRRWGFESHPVHCKQPRASC